MIVTKENEKLYLNNWNYNTALIISRLAQVVENNGGRVKPHKTALIKSRTHDKRIQDERNKEKRLALSKISNDFVPVTHTNYITFVFDGVHYYYQIDDNPFFEFGYIKSPIEKDGTVRKNRYLTGASKSWLYDCFFTFPCSYEDIKEAAQLIFNELVSADLSKQYKDTLNRTEKIDF